jgi:phage-related baseplate assembly protein
LSNITELANCPELNFIEHMTLQETEEQLRALYAKNYREITGSDPVIGAADPLNLLMKAFAAMEYQTMQYADTKGRMEMLNTSTGEALDALAALVGISRKGPTRATATVRFTLSEIQAGVVAVPAGTRVKTEDGKYFNTLDYAEIQRGETYADVVVQAQEAGAGSSGLLAGSIKILVDPIPYIGSVSNTTESTGGLDTEDDDSLTRRIYLSPSVYSCAGPRDAYEYYAREWRGDVADVRTDSPNPDEVDIYFVIEDEEGLRLPNSTELEGMREYMSAETMRPLCDKVDCLAPEEVEYSISLTYWIAESDQKSVSEIQNRVNKAVADFQTWQRKLGRDINPTELIARLREAGAKRVTLTAPQDEAVERIKLPKCTGASVTYGGMEDD